MVEISKTMTLADGRTLKILKGKGWHLKQAMRDMGEKFDKMRMLDALMGHLVTIDDKPIIPEELEELPLIEYANILSEFSDLGF